MAMRSRIRAALIIAASWAAAWALTGSCYPPTAGARARAAIQRDAGTTRRAPRRHRGKLPYTTLTHA